MHIARNLSQSSDRNALEHTITGGHVLDLVRSGVEASAQFATSLRMAVPVQVGRPQERLIGVLIALRDVTAEAAQQRADVLLDDGLEARAEAADLNRDADDVVDYDRYFDIQRVSVLTCFEQLVFSLTTMIEVSSTLPRTPGLSGDYASMIADQITRTFQMALEPLTSTSVEAMSTEKVIDVEDAGTHSSVDVATLPKGIAVELTTLKRWKLGHQMYGLANREATSHATAAVAAWQAGAPADVVANHVQIAAKAVGAITATMLYAASLTSTQYITEVRPTMAYPQCPNDLTGGMNLDHARYRKAMVEFLNEFDMKDQDLAATDQAVADARENLLAGDLMDLTEHIALTHRLVGTAPALDERDDGSAVQQLRSMLVDRTQRYAHLQRLGVRTLRNWSDDTKGRTA